MIKNNYGKCFTGGGGILSPAAQVWRFSVAVLLCVSAAIFTGCPTVDDDSGGDDTSAGPPPKYSFSISDGETAEYANDAELEFIEALKAALNVNDGGEGADNPVPVTIGGLNLSTEQGMETLYKSIKINPVKFVDLDLRGCYGATFSYGAPDYAAVKGKITGMTFPASVHTVSGTESSLSPTTDTTVRNRAFSDFTALKRVSMPGALRIGAYAFARTNTLEEIHLPKVTTIGRYAFADGRSRVSAGGNKITELTSANLPEVRTIEAFAFLNSGITTINLPKLEEIGEAAFVIGTNTFVPSTSTNTTSPANNTWLNSVYMPKTKTIGKNAFARAVNLTSCLLPKAEYIGENAFIVASATDFQSALSLPEAREIGKDAFKFRNIESVSAPKAVKLSGFANTKLAQIPALAPTLTLIGDNAFNGISPSFTGDIVLPPSVTEVGASAFAGHTGISSVRGNGVITIGESAFAGNMALTRMDSPGDALTTVNFPNVVTIGQYAFRYRYLLGSTSGGWLNFPNVETIGTRAFGMGGAAATSKNNISFRYVVMPKAKTLSMYAFEYCTNLAKIYFGDEPPTVNNTFNNIATGYYVYVPSGVLESYQNATAIGWTAAITGSHLLQYDSAYNTFISSWTSN